MAGCEDEAGNVVDGVTTAATLWFVTVMGLCFGGGQLALGAAAFGLAAFVLWCLKWAERALGITRRASLTMGFDANSAVEQQAAAALAAAGYELAAQSRSFSATDGCEVRYELCWREPGRRSVGMPELPGSLARQAGVRRLEWQVEID
jgi:putative Mg2+ transporter-C (MgtC) family protein